MSNTTDNSFNIHLAIPFFRVDDMERSLKFYLDGLGFSLINKWIPRGKIEWCYLQRDAVALMLQETRKANEFQEGNILVVGKGVSISFQCKDALALYHEFIERGLKIEEPFVGNNMWVVMLKDPDGYCLEFESMTDVAEETKYSDWTR